MNLLFGPDLFSCSQFKLHYLMPMIRLFFFLFALTFAFETNAETKTPQIIHDIESTYQELKQVESKFEQTIRSSQFPDRIARGTMIFQKPDRMRWDYEEPKGKVFVLTGNWIYLFDPLDEQVLKAPQPKVHELPMIMSILSGSSKLSEWFRCQETENEKVKDRISLRCEPKSEIPNVKELDLEVSQKAPHYILASTVVDFLGQSNTIRFSQIQEKGKIPPRRFDYLPPKDVPVVLMDLESIKIQ